MKEKKKCIECGQDRKMHEFNVISIMGGDIVWDDVCEGCNLSELAAVEEATSSCKSHSKGDSGKEKKGSGRVKIGQVDSDDLNEMGRSLAAVAGVDPSRINSISQEAYFRETNIASATLKWEDIQERAREYVIEADGLNFPDGIQLPVGKNYVVFGNSSGANVHIGILKAISNLCDYIAARPIHLGYAVDTYDCVSESLLAMKDLILVARRDEIWRLSQVAASRKNVTMVRDRIMSGKAMFRNQYCRSAKTSGPSKNAILGDDGYHTVVFDRYLHEVESLTKSGRSGFFISTGCCCAEFSMKKRKKDKFPKDMAGLMKHSVSSAASHMRGEELAKRWERGVTVVHVDSEGTPYSIPCMAKEVNGKWCIAYMGSIITEDEIVRADEIDLVVGDIHVPSHDPRALSVVEYFSKALKPDNLMNIGDHCNSSSLNHHALDRGEPIMDANIGDEIGMSHFLLVEMGKWVTGKCILIMGNHERFIKDFAARYPSLESIINQYVLLSPEAAGYQVVNLKDIYIRNKANYIHGELRFYGASGSVNDKIERVIGRNTMFGHCHRPSLRSGVVGIGLLGLLDQGYNEVEVSNWVHGFGICCHYGGEAFMSSIPIMGYKTPFGKKWISYGDDYDKWICKKFKVEMKYTPIESPGIDYESMVYSIAPAVFGASNFTREMSQWSGLPNEDLGNKTPSFMMATGQHEDVYYLLKKMLENKS